jgi:hypothetical protein
MRELFARLAMDYEFRWAFIEWWVGLTIVGNPLVWYELTKYQQWRKSYPQFLKAIAMNPVRALFLFSPGAAFAALYLFVQHALNGGVGDMPAARR